MMTIPRELRSARPTYTRRPVLLALTGMAVLWALSVGISLLYQTVPHEPLGRPDDFLDEAYPVLRQLFDLHVASFVRTSPAYIGSLIVRSPFSALGMALHADWQVVYCLTCLPCVIAAPILGAWLSKIREPWSPAFKSRWVWLSPLGILMLINPVVIFELILGHPEDIVGASLAIAGVVQATRGRESSAMLLVSLAVLNKTWALVAVPVALALLPKPSVRGLLILVLPIVALYVPVTVIQHGGALNSAATGAGTIFYPEQLWWWFGKNSFVAEHAHVLIILTAFVLAALWRSKRYPDLQNGRDAFTEALLLLGLVFLLRAAMDPWDNIYYSLPFLMCVYVLELGRPPRWSVALTVVMVAITVPLSHGTHDERAFAYQLATVPMIISLALRLFLPPSSWERLCDAMTKQRGRPAADGPVTSSEAGAKTPVGESSIGSPLEACDLRAAPGAQSLSH